MNTLIKFRAENSNTCSGKHAENLPFSAQFILNYCHLNKMSTQKSDQI